MKYTDEYKTLEYIVEGQFAHAKPTIEDLDDGTSEVKSYSHQAYEILANEKLDAATHYSASEIAVKFKSREAFYDHFDEDFTSSIDPQCQEINQKTWDFVVDYLQ